MQTLGVSIIQELGRGTSGIVYKVQSCVDGSFKVVKTIDLSSLTILKQQQALKEVQILKKTNHPHIIEYYNSICEDSILYILMEYASGGDLQSHILKYKQKHQYISENQIWAWAYEICLGVNYLHNHNILHRDLKCLNIFLDEKQRIKIGDMGLSEIINDKSIENISIGTPLFMSPEQIRRQPYGFKVDIWAIGCVIYTLCNLEAPFLGDNLLTLGHNITSLIPKPLPAKYSPTLQGLVNLMLEKDQNIRPKIKDIFTFIPSSIQARYKKPLNNVYTERKETKETPESLKVDTLPLISPYKRNSQYQIIGTKFIKYTLIHLLFIMP